MQKAFSLDINKCTGCQACEVACAIENQLDAGTSWRRIDTFNARRHPGIPLFHLSLACNHCADAPCMEHCPALAYTKDAETGAVTLHSSLCIGCRYCTWACPYDAPIFNDASGVVEKCTFCNDRLHSGQPPACVTQCPTGALRLTDANAADGVTNVTGFPRTEAGPAIRFIPLRAGHTVADTSLPSNPPGNAHDVARPPSKISLMSEWPLLVFTLLATLLVVIVAAPNSRASLDPFAFLIAGIAGAGFSTLHLGKKLRAHRAILNWRRSWLSREILSYSAFLGIATAHLLTPRLATWGAWAAILAGFATLFSVDRVYEVTRTRGLRTHSAQTLLTAMFLLGIVAGALPVVLVLGLLKATLYTARKMRSRSVHGAGDTRAWISVIRLGCGILIPIALLRGGGEPGVGVWVGVAIGEIIDRCEFYNELEVPTPRLQMAADLAQELARSTENFPGVRRTQ